MSYLNTFLGLLAKTNSRDTVRDDLLRYSDWSSISLSTLRIMKKREPPTMSTSKCDEPAKFSASFALSNTLLKSEKKQVSCFWNLSHLLVKLSRYYPSSNISSPFFSSSVTIVYSWDNSKSSARNKLTFTTLAACKCTVFKTSSVLWRHSWKWSSFSWKAPMKVRWSTCKKVWKWCEEN